MERQKTANWGDGFLQQMSQDLLTEFPKMKGFSYRNLRSIRQWFSFWSQELGLTQQAATPIGKQLVSKFETNSSQPVAGHHENVKQLVSQIPWGHNILLIQKLSDPVDALFYVKKTIENNWSRAVLTHQIESGLHLREGKAIDNFDATLPTVRRLVF